MLLLWCKSSRSFDELGLHFDAILQRNRPQAAFSCIGFLFVAILRPKLGGHSIAFIQRQVRHWRTSTAASLFKRDARLAMPIGHFDQL